LFAVSVEFVDEFGGNFDLAAVKVILSLASHGDHKTPVNPRIS